MEEKINNRICKKWNKRTKMCAHEVKSRGRKNEIRMHSCRTRQLKFISLEKDAKIDLWEAAAEH